ncbi:MAG: dockerin type I repeat-containing protein [Ruminococcus sp.]|nr:dockerin type I repeat-containing protein [Ruminococcus sp.]
MELKRRTLSLLTALLLIFGLAALMPPLTAHALGTMPRVNNDLTHKCLYWENYEGAAKYKVAVTSSVLNKTYTVTETDFYYEDVFTKKGVIYNIAVTACDSSGNALTRPYETHFIEEAEITGFKISSDLTVSWDKYNGDYEQLRIHIKKPSSGVGGTSADKDSTSKSLKEYMQSNPSGEYTIWITASVDLGYNVNVAESKQITFTYTSTEKFITTTKATVPTPYIGETAGQTASFVLNGGELKADDCIKKYEVQWKNPSGYVLRDDEVFKEGWPYTLDIFVYLKDGVYLDTETWLNKDKTSSVNGIATYMANGGGLTMYILTVTVYPEKPPTDLKTVNITAREPKPGEKPNYTGSADSTVALSWRVKLNSPVLPYIEMPDRVAWFSGSTELTESTTFKEGSVYTLKARIKANEGYALTKDTKVYINGRLASTTAENFSGYVTYSVDLKATDVIPGDVDDSGEVNMKDITTLQRYVNGWDVTINAANSDLDGSGDIGMKDITALQRLINS